MQHQETPSAQPDLEAIIEEFEAAQRRDGHADLADFLPPPANPRYQDALRELIRLDLEFGWKRGTPLSIEEYRRRFPAIDADSRTLHDVAFEEYRQRVEHGDHPSPDEYRQRYGIDLGNLSPGWDAQSTVEPPSHPHAFAPSAHAEAPPSELGAVSLAYQRFRQQHKSIDSHALDSWCSSFDGSAEHAHFFRDMHRADPEAAYRLACGATAMPQVGSKFLGFRLIGELGRGAFATVYLAQQGDLANRLVALKVSTRIMEESQTLAQLQHTNIVPIYSYHFADPFQAVCMPYLGGNTLADVLRVAESRGALPRSGKDLVSTLNERRSSTRVRSGTRPAPSDRHDAAPTPDSAPAVETPEPAIAPVASQKLEGRTYVEAVLWLAGQLADGLAHAHERGILHRDLKPANILLTDDGQPLLLDFNLSEDTKARAGAAAASIGGTLPYMSPEHLEAFLGGSRPVDARSDLYSFGVILYELLTARPPFPSFRGTSREILQLMIAERSKGTPTLRQWNPLVSPAVEAIVRRCLEPDPAQRYQSARQLQEDLERQQEHLPLKYAQEPSLRERLGKWVRRHPRLTSWTSVSALAGVLLLAMGVCAAAMIVGLQRRAENLKQTVEREQRDVAQKGAQLAYKAFDDEAPTAHCIVLFAQTSAHVEEGIQRTEELLDRYGVRSNPNWQNEPNVRLLDDGDRRRLIEAVGRLQQLVEWAKIRDDTTADKPELPSGERTAHDYYRAATKQARQGKHAAALKLLEEAQRLEPNDFYVHLLQGVCFAHLSMDVEAVSALKTCIALRPESPYPYFNRGLVFLKLRRFDRAKADFDKAIAQPSHSEQFVADARVNRALALEGLKKPKEALVGVEEVLASGRGYPRLHFVRKRLLDQLGDPKGAKAALEEGLRQEPRDELDWNSRGVARLAAKDHEGALADFNKALERNPRFMPALQNKAHVLGKYLNRLEDAVKVLDEAVRAAPEDARPVAGRGVYLARLGKRDDALRDAETAKRLDGAPANLYQIAGIYALTSKNHTGDKDEAFRLLSAALLKGFGFELLEIDTDLDPIRKEPQFIKLVEAARAVRAKK